MKRDKRVQAKHISDVQVLRAYVLAKQQGIWPTEVLMRDFNCPEKVAYAAMERADRRRLLDYGVSLRAGFLTEEGWLLLAREAGCELRMREEFAAGRHREVQAQLQALYAQAATLLEQLP